MESQLFQSSTFCKQTAVLLQKHHNILILKSRLSKHNRWETRRQVWQLIFWYLLQRYFSFCFPSFAAVHLFHLSVIKHTSFTILLVAYFNEIQSLFYEQTYRALNEKWKFRYHKEIVTKIMVRKKKNKPQKQQHQMHTNYHVLCKIHYIKVSTLLTLPTSSSFSL